METSLLRLDRIQAAPLEREPFDYTYVPEALEAAALPAIVGDFPTVPAGGSYDVSTLDCGPAFARLVEALGSDAFRAPFEEKFGLDLRPYPFHVTVRGQVRGRDGGIHTDSKDKVLTGLLYLNPVWTEDGGRLRLLRNGSDIDAYAREIEPVAGNMVVFRRSDRSWHGDLPSLGRRLSLQFSWVSGEAYARREMAGHRLAGWMKRVTGRQFR